MDCVSFYLIAAGWSVLCIKQMFNSHKIPLMISAGVKKHN
jgi:hypothetical protein